MRSIRNSQAGRRPPLSAHRIESRHSKPVRFVIAAQANEDPEEAAKRERIQTIRRMLGSPGGTEREDFEELLAEFDRLKEEIGDSEG